MSGVTSIANAVEAKCAAISRGAAIWVFPKTRIFIPTPSASPFDYPAALGLDPVAGVCADCIEVETGIPAAEVPVIIARLRRSVHIQTARGRCDVCSAIRTMYRGGPRAIDAIVEFLSQHRGTAFCSACIASRLTRVQDIDAAMRRVEGYGVTRHHAKCAACGRTRLVATLPKSGHQT
jgi:hypothetical protein